MLIDALGTLALDTIRQARSGLVSRLILAATALCVVLCLSLRFDASPPLKQPGAIELTAPDGRPLDSPAARTGRFSLAFGGLTIGMFRDLDDQVGFLQAILAKWVAGAAGTLLCLAWTASFLPDFLRPGRVSVLLAKPLPRGVLLLGNYLGVVAFVGAHAAIFILGTWSALGLRTGVWPPGYLLAWPILVGQFAVLYAFSTLLATWTRSTAACAFGSILFWAACLAMNHGRLVAVAVEARPTAPLRAPAAFRLARETAYWVLPKPADLAYLLDRATRAADHFPAPPEYARAAELGALNPALSLATAALFALAVLAIGAREFALTDY